MRIMDELFSGPVRHPYETDCLGEAGILSTSLLEGFSASRSQQTNSEIPLHDTGSKYIYI